ncbi:MAG: SDR family oxidoreductase [Planctomycetota bacterium]|jgi:3-oxoacyl-[acyl-carrier protein] reductase
MDLGLKDKGAVVLASTAGLGLAVAKSLAREGAKVAISGRDEARLDEATTAIGCWGETLDVTDVSALRKHLGEARRRLGSVDVLVTNAGGPPPGTALEVDDQGLDSALDLTMRSAVHAVQTVLPWMREKGWGRIIGMTSMSVRQPIATLAYSNIMRSGLTAYLKSLAGEVARDGILVNSVCTGMFATERLEDLFQVRAERSGRTVEEERAAAIEAIPAGRLGDPEEFGEFVAFLASERCSFLTGVALTYDGGSQRALL